MLLLRHTQTASAPRRSRRGGIWLSGFLLLFTAAHQWWRQASYVLLRDFAIRETESALAHTPFVTSTHFVVYYPPGQKAGANLVMHIANRALPFEENNLGEFPAHRLVIVVYADQQAMNQAVGLPRQDNNIGYQYHGIIDVLSPKAWLGKGHAANATFQSEGPVPHELGHELLNLKANGRYPNWFNEGVAQYEDFQVSGYQWITRNNSLTGPLYSMNALNTAFYQLPHQSRAYREGLALVQYLVTLRGRTGFHQFLDDIAGGQSFNQALSKVYHLTNQTALFQAWHQSLNPGTKP